MKTRASRSKRISGPTAPYTKKRRSKLPRRRRSRLSPLLLAFLSSIGSDSNPSFSSIRKQPVDSCSSSHFRGEVSCNSSGVSVFSDNRNIFKPLRKRQLDMNEGSGTLVGEEKFRSVAIKSCVVEASESSCVESCSGAEVRGFGLRSLKSKSAAERRAESVKEIDGDEDSETMTRSATSCVRHFLPESETKYRGCTGKFSKFWLENIEKTVNSLESEEDEAVSLASGLDFPSVAKFQKVCSSVGELLSHNRAIRDNINRASEAESSKISENCVTTKLNISNSGSTIKQQPGIDSDLACSEHLSYDDGTEYHASSLDTTFSEIFPENSELELSDYSPSIWFDSGSQFSEQSSENSTPSPTYSLFLQYSQQFSRASSPTDVSSVSFCVEDEYQDEFTLRRLEDEDDEESYQILRIRERRQAFLRNYADDYDSTTEYGDLIIQQRLQMVHWIVEQSTTKELQNETIFVGVNLLDRFLSKGFFKNKRSLQIVGIACLVLATRIEENQPLNSVRQMTFSIGSNVYSRCEVVAMEWLVQEVLNFRCFLPTIYNFLWFYLKAAKASAEVERRTKYLAVLALLDHGQLRYWPSTVAAGLVILASLAANQDASCQWVIETHVRTKSDDLPECIKSLEWLIKYVC